MQEEEIDVRLYVALLLKRWRWISGAVIGAVIVALIISSFLPLTYEATALVTVNQPRYILHFDPRMETTVNIQLAYKTYPELARSDAVLLELFASLPADSVAWATLADLRKAVNAQATTDPSLIKFAVEAQDPAVAARAVNLWAEIFVTYTNRVYGQSDQQVLFFEDQLTRIEAQRSVAEELLVAFQARNELAILNNRLIAVLQSHADYLADQQAIETVVADVEMFRAQLAVQPNDYQLSIADQLTALFLRVEALNAEAAPSLQVQITDATILSSQDVSEHIRFLDTLVAVLEQQSDVIDQKLQQLEPSILSFQQALQQAKIEEEHLTRAYDLTRETYTTVARKAEEARITAQGDGVVQIASQAALPEVPVGPRKSLNIAVAGTLGFLLSVLTIFVLDWWRSIPGNLSEQDT